MKKTDQVKLQHQFQLFILLCLRRMKQMGPKNLLGVISHDQESKNSAKKQNFRFFSQGIPFECKSSFMDTPGNLDTDLKFSDEEMGAGFLTEFLGYGWPKSEKFLMGFLTRNCPNFA